MDAETPVQKKSKSRQIVLGLLKFAISAALVWLLFRFYDLSAVLALVKSMDMGWVAFAVIAITISALLASLRWSWICAAMGGEIGFSAATRLVYIGLFFNQALPSNIGGDAARVWYLHKRQIPLRIAASSVIIDRVLALVALALIVLPFLISGYLFELDRALALVLLLGCLAILVGFGILLVFDRVVGVLGALLPVSLRGIGIGFADDFRAMMRQPAYGAGIILSAVLTQIAACAALAGLAFGLGIDQGWAGWLVIGPCAILASVIPLSFAGWGVREGTLIAILSVFSVPAEAALALSIAFGLLVLAGTLPGCPFWLFWRAEARGEVRDV